MLQVYLQFFSLEDKINCFICNKYSYVKYTGKETGVFTLQAKTPVSALAACCPLCFT